MTRILEHALEEAKRLPTERQDEFGEMILSVVEQHTSGLRLSLKQVTEVESILAAPIDIVPGSEVTAFFHKLTG